MSNAETISVIDHNTISPSIIENPIKTSVVPSKTSWISSIRKKKLTWILSGIILLILVTLAIVIPLIYRSKKNTNMNISTTDIITSTIITTEITTTTIEAATSTTTITDTTASQTEMQVSLNNVGITATTKWKQDGITVAGGNERGHELNQLDDPVSIYIDNNQTIYIADCENHRIMEWERNATEGRVVAGGNNQGNKTNQLRRPRAVIVGKEDDFLIVCDTGNTRIMRWPRRNGTEGEVIISDVYCFHLAMDNKGFIYTVDPYNEEVKRWTIGDGKGNTVAGGNGPGIDPDQLSRPHDIFVDQNYSVYVIDQNNDRVMKWIQNATEGIIVAGGHGTSPDATQLSRAVGLFVDQSGHIYVADSLTGGIMRWLKGSSKSSVILKGDNSESGPFVLKGVTDFGFDDEGSLYAVNAATNRVQKYYIDSK